MVRNLTGTPTEIRAAVTEMRRAMESRILDNVRGIEVMDREISYQYQGGVKIRLRLYLPPEHEEEGSTKIPVVL